MGLGESKCNNCEVNRATHYKIVTASLYSCKCSSVVVPKIFKEYNSTNNSLKYNKSISNVEYYPERCTCQHREDYSTFITRTLRTNIPILEFKGLIPEDPINDDNIEWVFLACDDCIKDRPWVKQYMTRFSDEDMIEVD